MVCLHVLVRAPTERLVRADHHARRVNDVLDRCHSPDAGRTRLAPAPVVQNQQAAPAQEHGLVRCRYLNPPSVSDTFIHVDERHQACYRHHADIIAVRTCCARDASERRTCDTPEVTWTAHYSADDHRGTSASRSAKGRR
jgi:hypothetical protein